MISILGLVVIAVCIAVAMMYPPVAGDYVFTGTRRGTLVGARSAALRNVMYLAAAATAALAVILSISPWGRSKD